MCNAAAEYLPRGGEGKEKRRQPDNPITALRIFVVIVAHCEPSGKFACLPVCLSLCALVCQGEEESGAFAGSTSNGLFWPRAPESLAAKERKVSYEYCARTVLVEDGHSAEHGGHAAPAERRRQCKQHEARRYPHFAPIVLWVNVCV